MLALLIALIVLPTSVARASLGYEQDESLPSITLHGEVAHGVAIDQASHRIYVAELTQDSVAQKPGQVEQLESTGVPTPNSPFKVESSEAAFSGVAVNPITHGIYAAQFILMSPFGPIGASKIDLFSAAGTVGTQFATSNDPSQAVQIAADSNGKVYFPSNTADAVQVFSESGALQETISCTGCPGGGFVTPYSVAIDSANNLYVVDIGLDRVLKFTRSGGSYIYSSLLQSGRGAGSVGVDPADNSVFVGDFPEEKNFHVVAYDSSGTEFDDFGAGLFAGSPFGMLTVGQIAANATTHKLYVTDASNNTIHVFDRVSVVPPPTATSDPASPVGQVAATLNATVDAGIHAVTDCEFEYVDNAGFEANGFGSPATAPCASLPIGSGSLPAEVTLSGLQPSTTYHFRVTAASNAGSAVGSGLTFTTLPNAPATVTPQAASEIKQTTAKLAGKVNPHGGSVSDCHFEYSTGLTFELSKPCPEEIGLVTTDVAQSLKVTGLLPSTTYHYRLVVTSNAGPVTGGAGEFKTLPPAPAVTTESASAITQTSATVTGAIDPNGAPSSCHFEYGLTSSYGSSVACASDPGEGTGAVAEQLVLSGLTAGTTYHYRLVGTNPGGTTNGADQSFTTLSPPSPPVTQPPVTQPTPPVIKNPRALKCKKGFCKAKVHGKLKCVKKKHSKHRHR